MRSPRFSLREPQLRPLFDKANLRRIWKDKVRNALRQQFLVDPIDHLDFHQNLSAECRRLELSIISGQYIPSETRRILQEKSKGLCRQLVIPAVDDAIVLQCLSDAMYRDIRNKEPTANAFFEPSDHHFSKRHGLFQKSEYGSFRAWLMFQKEIFRFSKEREYLVVTDVANYYDTISYTHLRNIISDVTDVHEPILDMLIYVLSGLLWQPDYMPRVEIGLPQMNVDAPRILAHCFLFELDTYLTHHHTTDFVRFMDDIDAGVDTLADARKLLRSIDLVLQTRHIRLNSGKTLILSRHQALAHFRVHENLLIDKVEERIDGRVKRKVSITRERISLSSILLLMWKNERFDSGNGEKILKRLLQIARRIGADVDRKFIYDIILRRPACRLSAMQYIASMPGSPGRARLLYTAISNDQIVDDATYVNCANTLVETAFPSRIGVHTSIKGLISSMPLDTSFGYYSALWIASKYVSSAEILSLILEGRDIWSADPWLGRLVGGLYPIFIGSKFESELRRIIALSSNTQAQRVYDFHDDLRRDVDAFTRCYAYIKSPNFSKRTKIAHSKYLLLISALSNNTAKPAHTQNLIQVHSGVWADIYYRQRAELITKIKIPSSTLLPYPFP